ncbi:ATP-binding protein [Streptomyces sp. S1A(2023)]
MALVVAQEVPASSSMAIPHGPAGVGQARHRMREQLRGNGVSDAVVDDAVLILSELLSNACRHGRPLGWHTDVGDGDIRAAWRVDTAGALTVEVTDGGGPTRPVPATPSVTARGGRGLNIISALAQEWGVRDGSSGEVTVWALVLLEEAPRHRRQRLRGERHRRERLRCDRHRRERRRRADRFRGPGPLRGLRRRGLSARTSARTTWAWPRG